MVETFLTTQANWLITGFAGTGKSTLVREIVQALKDGHYKPPILCAPTGIAAMQIGGTTIHRAFALSVRGGQTFAGRLSAEQSAAIAESSLIIIDDVSMLRADLLDMVSEVMKKACNNAKPFGGKRLLLAGI